MVFDSSNPGVRKASVKTFGTKQNFGDGRGRDILLTGGRES